MDSEIYHCSEIFHDKVKGFMELKRYFAFVKRKKKKSQFAAQCSGYLKMIEQISKREGEGITQ